MRFAIVHCEDGHEIPWLVTDGMEISEVFHQFPSAVSLCIATIPMNNLGDSNTFVCMNDLLSLRNNGHVSHPKRGKDLMRSLVYLGVLLGRRDVTMLEHKREDVLSEVTA